jgi:hypothetical protein
MQLTVDKQDELESTPAWINLSVAKKRLCIDQDKTLIKSEIVQYLVNKSDFNFVKMAVLN